MNIAAAASPRVAQQTWGPCAFVAHTRFGPVHLTLQARMAARAPAGEGVLAAMLLGHAEPLLHLLEDWLQQGLDPDPIDREPAESGVLADVLLGSAGREATLRVRLQLPWRALQETPVPDAALRERLAVLQWRGVPLQLVLSRQALSEAEWATLCQPGAALLLPESFAGTAWPCLLQPLEAEAPLQPARWDAAQGRLRWQAGEGRAEEAPAGPVGVEVVLDELLCLTPPQLLAWSGDEACACGGQRARLRRTGAPGPEGSGELVPLGLRADGRPGWLLRIV